MSNVVPWNNRELRQYQQDDRLRWAMERTRADMMAGRIDFAFCLAVNTMQRLAALDMLIQSLSRNEDSPLESQLRLVQELVGMSVAQKIQEYLSR